MKHLLVISTFAMLVAATAVAQPPGPPPSDVPEGERAAREARIRRGEAGEGRAVMPGTDIRPDRIAPGRIGNPDRPLVTPSVRSDRVPLGERREVITTPKSAVDEGINTPSSRGTPTAIDRSSDIDRSPSIDRSTGIDRSTDIDRSSGVNRGIQTNVPEIEKSVGPETSGEADRRLQDADKRRPGGLVITPRAGGLTNDDSPVTPRVGTPSAGERPSLNRTRTTPGTIDDTPGAAVDTPTPGASDTAPGRLGTTPRARTRELGETPGAAVDTPTPGASDTAPGRLGVTPRARAGETPGAAVDTPTPGASDTAPGRTGDTPRGRGRGLGGTPATGAATPFVPSGTPPGGRAVGREAREAAETPGATPDAAATPADATATPATAGTPQAGRTPRAGRTAEGTPATGTPAPSPAPSPTARTDADATATPAAGSAAGTPAAGTATATPDAGRRGRRGAQASPLPTRAADPNAAPIAITPSASPTPGATPVPTPAEVTPTPNNFRVDKNWKPYPGWRAPSGWQPPRDWDIDWTVPPGYNPPREWHPRLYNWGWTYVSGRGWVVPRGWQPPPDFVVPPGWYYLPEERYGDYGFYNPGRVTVVRGVARPRVRIETSSIYIPPEPVPHYIEELAPPPPRPIPQAPPEIVEVDSTQEVVEVLTRKRTEETNRYAGPVLVTESVHFDVDSYAIKPESFPALDAIGESLTKPPLDAAILNIEGHTDSDASDEYNQQLSEQRAWSVKSYLVEKWGIDPNRLVIVGFGETSPIADNAAPEGKARNRRVEFENVTDLYETEVTKTTTTESKEY